MRPSIASVTMLAAAMTAGAARADGPTAQQLQVLLATGPTADNGQKAASAYSLAQGAIQSAGGDAGQALVLPSTPGASNHRRLADRSGERPAVADFAAQGGAVGGAAITTILQPQARGDTSMTVAPIAQAAMGMLVTSPLLPAGTRIASLGQAASGTISQATDTATLTDPEQQAAATMSGLSNQLHFPAVFAVPAGASVSGSNIPAGSTVVGVAYPASGGTAVYLSGNVAADVASGTTVSFSYVLETVTLSAAWLSAAPAGTAIGLATQDDAAAFQGAAFWSARANGGRGARVFVPSGTYFLSSTVSTYDGVSFEFGPQVSFTPGSALIDTADAGFASTAEFSIFGGYRNPTATTVNISQAVYQDLMPSLQGQALLVNQLNVSCTNDGSAAGCGIVAEEIKQAMAANIRRGTLWGYHETDSVSAGQGVSWSGAEIELQNNSGNDIVWNGVEGSKTGLHIDNIGNTMNSVVLLPGGAIGGGGSGWHRALDCPAISVSDYCFDIQTGPLQAGTSAPVILAALDMTGKYSGTALSITGGATIGGTIQAGAIQASGSIVSAPTASTYTVQASDCGTTLEPAASVAVVVTVPSGLPSGCRVDVDEVAGQPISFQAGSAMTMRAYNNATKLAGNYASARILVDSAGAFLLSGQIQ